MFYVESSKFTTKQAYILTIEYAGKNGAFRCDYGGGSLDCHTLK
jgi:hypothetical protein